MLYPRQYQIEANAALINFLETKQGHPVVAMPTGTGKSVNIAMVIWELMYRWPGLRIMVLTHVKELIDQNYNKLKELWPEAPAGIYSAGLGRKEAYFPITFAGIGSVANKLHHFGRIDILIVDEAHRVPVSETTMYRKVIAEVKQAQPLARFIAFTATPWQLGHGHITDEGGIFTDVCFDLTGVEAFNRLIAEGYLCKLVPKKMRTMLDVDGVHMRGGEFIAGELQAAVNRSEITEAALDELVEFGQSRNHWLLFASGVEHADNIGQMLRVRYGLDSVVIHSKMEGGDKARDRAIDRFKAGDVRIAINNNVLTTGFDFPGIDLIGMLRPTASPVLWVQMLGRGTRPSPGKEDCLVLDFARNTKRLGPINDPTIPRKAGKGGGEAPVKECPKCETYCHASVRFCDCGHEFTFLSKLKNSAGTDDLISGELPVVEVFNVAHITYSVHTKLGAPPMVRITYYCGMRSFSEYLCVQHEGWARRKAQEWWKLRSSSPMPATTDEALALTQDLLPATHLRVWVNKKYPQIMSACFDGTAFGTQADDGVRVEVEVHAPVERSVPYKTEEGKVARMTFDDMDDDIPF